MSRNDPQAAVTFVIENRLFFIDLLFPNKSRHSLKQNACTREVPPHFSRQHFTDANIELPKVVSDQQNFQKFRELLCEKLTERNLLKFFEEHITYQEWIHEIAKLYKTLYTKRYDEVYRKTQDYLSSNIPSDDRGDYILWFLQNDSEFQKRVVMDYGVQYFQNNWVALKSPGRQILRKIKCDMEVEELQLKHKENVNLEIEKNCQAAAMEILDLIAKMLSQLLYKQYRLCTREDLNCSIQNGDEGRYSQPLRIAREYSKYSQAEIRQLRDIQKKATILATMQAILKQDNSDQAEIRLPRGIQIDIQNEDKALATMEAILKQDNSDQAEIRLPLDIQIDIQNEATALTTMQDIIKQDNSDHADLINVGTSNCIGWKGVQVPEISYSHRISRCNEYLMRKDVQASLKANADGKWQGFLNALYCIFQRIKKILPEKFSRNLEYSVFMSSSRRKIEHCVVECQQRKRYSRQQLSQ